MAGANVRDRAFSLRTRWANQRIRVRVTSLILVAPLALTLVPSTSTAAPLNLYEWMALAPVIVAGENLGTYGKYAEFKVQSVYRRYRCPIIFVCRVVVIRDELSL